MLGRWRWRDAGADERDAVVESCNARDAGAVVECWGERAVMREMLVLWWSAGESAGEMLMPKGQSGGTGAEENQSEFKTRTHQDVVGTMYPGG